jgi:hypothetical protein
MIWGAFTALLVFAARSSIFANRASILVFGCLIGLWMWSADTLHMKMRAQISKIELCGRFVIWLVLYEALPAALICALAHCGVFVLDHGTWTAMLMCLPMSIVTLRNYVNWSRLVGY